MPERALISALAPETPPCFADRLAWIEYLMSALKAKHPIPASRLVLIEVDGRPAFNPSLNICLDCSAQHSFRMQLAGRCKPSHIRDCYERTAGAAKPVPGAVE